MHTGNRKLTISNYTLKCSHFQRLKSLEKKKIIERGVMGTGASVGRVGQSWALKKEWE